MAAETIDSRSPRRRDLDDQIAAEVPLASLNLPPATSAAPVEAYLTPRRRPLALAGIVENGMIRPLDPGVSLAENSRVIIVASEA